MALESPDLSLVRRLKTKGRYDEALRLLRAWLASDPENPRLLQEIAETLDNQGREEEAIPYYRQALAGDLDVVRRVDAIVGLGSSLRVVGEVAESYRVLEEGVRQFPDHVALKVFFALTLERMGNYGQAIDQLLDVITLTGKAPSLDPYKNSIRYYRAYRHDGRYPSQTTDNIEPR